MLDINAWWKVLNTERENTRYTNKDSISFIKPSGQIIIYILYFEPEYLRTTSQYNNKQYIVNEIDLEAAYKV